MKEQRQSTPGDMTAQQRTNNARGLRSSCEGDWVDGTTAMYGSPIDASRQQRARWGLSVDA